MHWFVLVVPHNFGTSTKPLASWYNKASALIVVQICTGLVALVVRMTGELITDDPQQLGSWSSSRIDIAPQWDTV